MNSGTWLANPLPARNSFTRPFVLSHAALAAATVAYLVYAVSVDTPHAFMLTSYLLVAWVFQAPGRFMSWASYRCRYRGGGRLRAG